MVVAYECAVAHSCLKGGGVPQHARGNATTARKGKRKLEDDSEECCNYSFTVIVEVLMKRKLSLSFLKK